MINPLVMMLAVMAATWDAWRWYATRIAAAPEEGAALGLTVALIAALAWRGTRVSGGSEQSRTLHALLWTLAALLGLYAVSFGHLPPLARAALAVAATLLCLYTALLGRFPPVAFWGLVALALPVLPSLQFVLGYGMRVVSAALTVGLLQAQGFAVARQGTFLLWHGEMVQFDAPCSGVNMLWAGLLIAFMGALALRLSVLHTVLITVVAVVLTVLGNVLRAASLFVIETGMIAGVPVWAHEAVGVVSFLMAAACVLWLLARLDPAGSPHAEITS